MIDLPYVSIAEWTAIRRNTSMGLFAYRQMQALDLFNIPDYGGGDLTAEQRKEALISSVYCRKPLGALGMLLSVASFEDFIRDFFARMKDNTNIAYLFPELTKLKTTKHLKKPEILYKRLDKDPFDAFDPEEINNTFEKVFQIRPISDTEYSKIRDLILIRHTVAHHAAVIREIDVPRFHYYKVSANQPINPPIDFIKETIMYIYKIGRNIEDDVRNAVFSKYIPTLNEEWYVDVPKALISLFEFFDYFGFIETAIGPVGYAAPGTEEYNRMQRNAEIIKSKLVERCVNELIERIKSI